MEQLRLAVLRLEPKLRTMARKARDAKEKDFRSPGARGDNVSSRHQSYELAYPEHFKPTATHYDERETFGTQFPKRIQPTQWAVKHGLAGRYVKSVTVPELAWMGWSNGHIRALANGRFVSLMFARSIREANFTS